MGEQALDPNLHWLANYQAELVFLDDKTRLGKTSHFGPLRVQRPFYPEGNQCAHLYLLHPPGGLVAGDYLTISLDLDKHAEALVTTPSAGKIYNNITELSQFQKVSLSLKEQAILEWMPQETIVFDGAKGELLTEVELAESAIFAGWDIVCLGRPSSEDWFERGHVLQSFVVKQDKKPIFIERNLIKAGELVMNNRAGLSQQPVFGTFVIAGTRIQSDESDAEQSNPTQSSSVKTGAPMHFITPLSDEEREQLELTAGEGLFAVTQKPDVTMVRYLGACAETAKKVFAQYWAMRRHEINDRAVCAPRIWNT